MKLLLESGKFESNGEFTIEEIIATMRETANTLRSNLVFDGRKLETLRAFLSMGIQAFLPIVFVRKLSSEERHKQVAEISSELARDAVKEQLNEKGLEAYIEKGVTLLNSYIEKKKP